MAIEKYLFHIYLLHYIVLYEPTNMFVKLLYFLNNTLSFIYDLTYSTYLCGPVFVLSSHIVMQIRLHYSAILNAFNKILLVRHEFYPQTIKKIS